jgi:hypothetical protein
MIFGQKYLLCLRGRRTAVALRRYCSHVWQPTPTPIYRDQTSFVDSGFMNFFVVRHIVRCRVMKMQLLVCKYI